MSEKIVIVGGGVIGLGIGWRLAKAGKDVVVIDRDRKGEGASWASAGMLTPLAEVRFQEEDLLKFGMYALTQYPEFVAELESDAGQSVGYRQDGVLLVGITQDDIADLQFRFDFQKDLGLDVAWMSRSEAREREPHLSPQVSAAVWCSGDHQVDNRLLVEALLSGFEKAGGTLKDHTSVEQVEIEGARVKGVVVEGELIPAGTVVLAAGAWSRLLPGIPEKVLPPVRPVRGQIIRLEMTEAVTLETIVWYNRWSASVTAYMVPKDGGHLLLGATSEEMGFDQRLTAGGLFELCRAAWEAVPGIYDLPIVETQAGLRPGSRDDAPILGKTPIEGLVMATGHHRKGILMTPVTSNAISELILTGKTPDVIRPYGIDRF